MNGIGTTKVRCECRACCGLGALVKGDGANLTPTMVHNLVRVAHSPLARAASSRQHGPWAI